MSRATRYATSVIAGMGRTIGSRIFCKTRIVAWCSDSDELSEANRNPESSRTAIPNSSSIPRAYRLRREGSHPRGQQYYLVLLSNDLPSITTTWPPVKFDLHLSIRLRFRPHRSGFLEAVEALGDVPLLAT